ncbi:MAG: UDP-N-acetylmuramate--L-alanine ligase [Chloroflexi bacterium]|nr:UDP-N-acetylmuramate--L-alanine ligase [Chloroflexota bacterium]
MTLAPLARPAIVQEKVHFVGIGGIGLSAIAHILLNWGGRVSGSDLRLSKITDELAALGARVCEGQRAENLGDATLVVISSAIRPDNPEVAEARRRGLPVLKRADILGEMMAGRHGIAVAGTHGKTTTTAMIAHILLETGRDPTYLVGGILANTGTNAGSGQGAAFVIEADEYDRMFLGLRPRTAVVTHLEMDHPDCFPTLGDLREAFGRFLDLVPADGRIIACADEPNVRALVAGRPQALSYGLSPEAQWRAAELRPNARGGLDFDIWAGGVRAGEASLALPGAYNVKNALAALAAAQGQELSLAECTAALASFSGVRRRFELKGEARGVAVVDDYAHHPTAVLAALAAARQRFPGQGIWAVFQPHTYSRMRALFAEFACAFGEADHVLVLDVYAAREDRDAGLQAADLAAAMAGRDVRYCAAHDEAVAILTEELRPGDVVITLGAGDGFRIGEKVLDNLAAR